MGEHYSKRVTVHVDTDEGTIHIGKSLYDLMVRYGYSLAIHDGSGHNKGNPVYWFRHDRLSSKSQRLSDGNYTDENIGFDHDRENFRD
jgi:hypothetical protein